MTASAELSLPGDWCALDVQEHVPRLKMRIAKAVSRENLYLSRNCRVTRPYRGLEPDESKGSSPVLRGEGGRKAPVLPGCADRGSCRLNGWISVPGSMVTRSLAPFPSRTTTCL